MKEARDRAAYYRKKAEEARQEGSKEGAARDLISVCNGMETVR